ncbi:MAG: hypothetical protein L3J83_07100 [Proteobacteria bacterium]|nr:hypothetical protein [Pseudomonadota bacterium]
MQKKLPNKDIHHTVVNPIKASFKSASYDNYTITTLAIQEIISRKDVAAQKQVIALFDDQRLR